jgi:Tfp pilus assembly protein PilF
MIAQRVAGAIHSGDFTFSNRLQNALVSYMRYAGKAIWPSDLASFYPHPQHLPALQIVFAALFLISVTGAVLLFHRAHPYLMIGWLWFVGTMVPVIGLVQAGEQGMADRYAYLPFVGLFLLIVWGLAECAEKHKIAATYLAVAAICLLSALAVVTHKQIGYWKNTRTLWEHTLSITDHNHVAEASLGAELIAEGDIQGAMTHLQAGIAINPRDPFSRLDLGVCEKRLGHVNEAIAQYQAALNLAQDDSLKRAAYRNLGSIYRIQKQYDLASKNFRAALQILPDDIVALTGLGLIAEKTRQSNDAVDYFSRATKSQPGDSQYLLLARALAQAGRPQESQAAMARAQMMSQSWDATVQGVDRLLRE